MLLIQVKDRIKKERFKERYKRIILPASKNASATAYLLLSPESRFLNTHLDKYENIIRDYIKPSKLIADASPISKSIHLAVYKMIPILEKQTKFQHILLAKIGDRIALFQDDEWQFLSGKDSEGEFHKHEAYLPTLLTDSECPKVAIIGGGDGLAARDILNARGCADIDLVDIDGEMIELARKHPILRKLNNGSIDKVNPIPNDGISFLLNPKNRDKYDLIVIDLPDPIRPSTQFLYDTPLIIGILNAVKPNGVVSIYATAFDSKLQNYLLKELRKYFLKVWKVGAHIKNMGKAGFVWAKYKNPKIKITDNILMAAYKMHLRNIEKSKRLSDNWNDDWED